MPGQDAGHHRQAGAGVALSPAGHQLQRVGQFSGITVLLLAAAAILQSRKTMF